MASDRWTGRGHWIHEGGTKGVSYLPSSIAFGRDGSSTGIIPPFTSVVFEVELLNVHRGHGLSMTAKKDSLK